MSEQKSFSKSSHKTYTLVELVRGAPTAMVDHGPEDTVFAFPVVALIEAVVDIGSDPVPAADVDSGECPPRRDRQSKPDHRPG